MLSWKSDCLLMCAWARAILIDYAVNIVQTAGGAEYRNLVHQYPMRDGRSILR
jgi:hypothetical protein